MWRRLRDDFLWHIDLHVVAMCLLILPFDAALFLWNLRGIPTSMHAGRSFWLLMVAFNLTFLLGPWVYVLFHSFARNARQHPSRVRFLFWQTAVMELLCSVTAGIVLLIRQGL